MHTTGGSDDGPYGKNLGKVLYWPAFFKRHGIKFWLNFLEHFGGPTAIVIGKHPQSASQEDMTVLEMALISLSIQTGIAIPQGMEIELIQATGKGGEAGFETLLRYLDSQASILGVKPSPRRSAKRAAVRPLSSTPRVLQCLGQGDAAALLDNTLNNTFLRWFQAIYFPSAKPKRTKAVFSFKPMRHARILRL